MPDNRLSLPQLLRLAAVVFVAAWFLVPGYATDSGLASFLALAALEASFLVSGLARARNRAAEATARAAGNRHRGAGGEEWLEPVLVEVDGQQVPAPDA